MPLLKPHILAYKISNSGNFEVIDYKQLLATFTPNSAIGVYAYKSKRLYFWKGKALAFNMGKFIPDAKKAFLQQDPSVIILRHIIIESGDEPAEFLEDLKIKPSQLQDQIENVSQDQEEEIQKAIPSEQLEKSTSVPSKDSDELGRNLRVALIRDRIALLFKAIPTLCNFYTFDGAQEKLDEIVILAQRNQLSEYRDQIDKTREKITNLRSEYYKNLDLLSQLETKVRETWNAKQWEAVLAPCEKIIEVATKVGKNDLVAKYIAMNDDAKEKIEEDEWNKIKLEENGQPKFTERGTSSPLIKDDPIKLEHLSSALQLAELRYINARKKNMFFECMKSIADILNIAEKINRHDLTLKYGEIKKEITAKLEQNAKKYTEKLEKIERINQLKKLALDLETNLLFEDAREKNLTIRALAIEIDDKDTIAACDRKIIQLDDWVNQTNEFDLQKWEIPAENIIEEQKYHLLEAFNDFNNAQKRAEEILTNSGNGEVVKVITLIQSKFANQGPYNGKGESYAIYGMKKPESIPQD